MSDTTKRGFAVVLIVWAILFGLGVLAVAVPGVRHRRRVQAWDRELADAFGRTEERDREVRS